MCAWHFVHFLFFYSVCFFSFLNCRKKRRLKIWKLSVIVIINIIHAICHGTHRPGQICLITHVKDDEKIWWVTSTCMFSIQCGFLILNYENGMAIQWQWLLWIQKTFQMASFISITMYELFFIHHCNEAWFIFNLFFLLLNTPLNRCSLFNFQTFSLRPEYVKTRGHMCSTEHSILCFHNFELYG